jgi:hypothetical protein
MVFEAAGASCPSEHLADLLPTVGPAGRPWKDELGRMILELHLKNLPSAVAHDHRSGASFRFRQQDHALLQVPVLAAQEPKLALRLSVSTASMAISRNGGIG